MSWFTEPRRSAQSRIQAYTPGNKVTGLIDQEYMQAVHDLITQAGEGDVLCIAGLRMENVRLLGNSKPESALLPLLGEAKKRGADVKIILDGNFLHIDSNEKTSKELKQYGIDVLIDRRHPSIYGSQHQKLLCLQKKSAHAKQADSIIALVGSADLCFTRQDTNDHKLKSKERSKKGHATHETGVRIEGPASVDLLRSFYERQGIDAPIPEQPAKGHIEVQVLRTYAKTPAAFPSLKQGEFSILDAYLNAVKNAKKMIYIEDQYFWMNENNRTGKDVVRELGEAIRRGVKVAVVAPSYFEGPAFLDWISAGHQRNAAIQYLSKIAQNSSGDFTFTTLRNKDEKTKQTYPVYVHSKCLCIDDEFVLSGSANVNDRSMYHDSELSVGIFDPKKKFARNHLRRLLAEHLEMPQENLDACDLNTLYEHFKKGSKRLARPSSAQRLLWIPMLTNTLANLINPGPLPEPSPLPQASPFRGSPQRAHKPLIEWLGFTRRKASSMPTPAGTKLDTKAPSTLGKKRILPFPSDYYISREKLAPLTKKPRKAPLTYGR